MWVSVELVGRIVVSGTADNLEQIIEMHLDQVMEELETLVALDPAISLDLSDNSVILGVTVEATDPIEAVNTASGQLRAAIHAAGGGTPNWPELASEAWSISLINVQAALVETADDELLNA